MLYNTARRKNLHSAIKCGDAETVGDWNVTKVYGSIKTMRLELSSLTVSQRDRTTLCVYEKFY